MFVEKIYITFVNPMEVWLLDGATLSKLPASGDALISTRPSTTRLKVTLQNDSQTTSYTLPGKYSRTRSLRSFSFDCGACCITIPNLQE